jgi:GTPase SAR1 family protein
MLPQFYKNLFSGRSSISEDFWIKRERDEDLFRKGVRRYNSGSQGGIMVIGDRNSGKTAFCRYITERLFKKEKIHHIFPLQTGSVKVSDFEDELRKITSTAGEIKDIMETLPRGTVFIIHDLELWWEHSINGWEVVRLLIDLINEYGKNFLFVVNMNPYAFDIMNKMLNLQDVFISVIPLRPFDSKEIEEIIIRRHRSSGLKFVLKKSEEEGLSEIRMAKLFNKYFNYSDGNPGTALKAWLCNIVRVTDKKIYIQSPISPNTKILTELDEEWIVILTELILQKRLTQERINRIFFDDYNKARLIINSMLRAGLIEERGEKLYIVNRYIESHLINVFKGEEVLRGGF